MNRTRLGVAVRLVAVLLRQRFGKGARGLFRRSRNARDCLRKQLDCGNRPVYHGGGQRWADGPKRRAAWTTFDYGRVDQRWYGAEKLPYLRFRRFQGQSRVRPYYEHRQQSGGTEGFWPDGRQRGHLYPETVSGRRRPARSSTISYRTSAFPASPR